MIKWLKSVVKEAKKERDHEDFEAGFGYACVELLLHKRLENDVGSSLHGTHSPFENGARLAIRIVSAIAPLEMARRHELELFSDAYDIRAWLTKFADYLDYPATWDTAAYPTVFNALYEILPDRRDDTDTEDALPESEIGVITDER